MKRLLYTFALVAALASVAFVQNRAGAQTPAQNAAAPDAHGKLLNTYCVGCHNSRAKIGGLALDNLDL